MNISVIDFNVPEAKGPGAKKKIRQFTEFWAGGQLLSQSQNSRIEKNSHSAV